jgi:hypothetical protein
MKWLSILLWLLEKWHKYVFEKDYPEPREDMGADYHRDLAHTMDEARKMK